MRARYPDREDHVERDGVRVFYESYGCGEPAVLLLPTWEIVHSRAWKCQIPDVARYGRAITFDRRGSGRSDRPADVRAYDRRATAEDALAVLDAAGAERPVVVSWCGAGEELILATEHPDRVAGLVLLAPDLLLTPGPVEAWREWDADDLRRDWRGFLEVFFAAIFTEPHSTKQIEDAIAWGSESDPETIVRGLDAAWPNGREEALALCGRVRCPTLVIQGTEDAIVGPERGAAVAAAIPGADLVTLAGCGHAPHLREPVVVNRLLREFSAARNARWRS